MHAENEREFELVLGNKQLLGLLFVTFVLLGVFFALGYAMGRSSAPSPIVDALGTAGQSQQPAASQTPKPAVSEGVVATSKPEPVASTPTESGTPAQVPAAETPKQEPPPATVTMLDPKPGETYLQVMAVKRPEAEVLLEVLARKGFKAGLTAAPVEGMYRVLVGPVLTDAEQGQLKSDLEKAGFKPIPRRF